MDLKKVKVNVVLLAQPNVDIMHLKLETLLMTLNDLKMIFLKSYENPSIQQTMQTGISHFLIVKLQI